MKIFGPEFEKILISTKHNLFFLFFSWGRVFFFVKCNVFLSQTPFGQQQTTKVSSQTHQMRGKYCIGRLQKILHTLYPSFFSLEVKEGTSHVIHQNESGSCGCPASPPAIMPLPIRAITQCSVCPGCVMPPLMACEVGPSPNGLFCHPASR